MTVARVGETVFWAQFMPNWMRMLLRPSPMAPTSHTQENSGTDSPRTGIRRNDSSPAAYSWTTVTRPRSTRPA